MDQTATALLAESAVGGDNLLSLAWQRGLTAVACANLLAWVALWFRSGGFRGRPWEEPLSLAWWSRSSLWGRIWGFRRTLALVYVVACGVRSVWPRHDADRVCFWDSPLSPPLVGRSLAFVAELCFAALVCVAVVRVMGTAAAHRVAAVVLAANVIAQLCCSYSVITQDNRGHVIEESIWTLSAVLIVALCASHVLDPTAPTLSRSPAAAAFLRTALVAGSVYVAFMVYVDVPMYINRVLADAARGKAFAGLMEGLRETATCVRITTSDAYWTVEMPWMSLYFSIAVWAALWLASADIEEGGGSEGTGGQVKAD